MDMEAWHELMLRHERGERSDALMDAIDRAAWECCHDPWEERPPRVIRSASPRQGPIPTDLAPGEMMDLSASTVDLYMVQCYPDQFRRKERPFVVQYACQIPAEATRRITLQIEGRGRHDLLFRILYPIECTQEDLRRALELVQRWNDAHPSGEARLMNAQALMRRWGDLPTRTLVVALESRTRLEPDAGGLSLERLREMMEGVLAQMRAFTRKAVEKYGF